MAIRFTNYVGKKGVEVSIRTILLIVIFTLILIVLAFILNAFTPNQTILDKAKTIAINLIR